MINLYRNRIYRLLERASYVPPMASKSRFFALRPYRGFSRCLNAGNHNADESMEEP
jgi:hypothetical protein